MIKVKEGKKYFYRFSLNQRIQHIILAIVFTVLVLTGMPLKYADASWAPYIYDLFGGIKYAPLVHKINGAIICLLFLYHIFYLIVVIKKYHIEPAKKEKGKLSTGEKLKIIGTQALVPNLKDAKDIRDLMKYLLYFTNKRPEGDNFTWKEKFDYLAPVWGMVVIGGSGIIMWYKEIASEVLPGWAINFSLIAHSDEALLAALFIFIWHWYNAHFSLTVFPMGMSFLTGYIPEELMVEEHYQYYVEVMKKEGLEHEICPQTEPEDKKDQIST
jgi:cytochrome b subunit of formate dehydrogenase